MARFYHLAKLFVKGKINEGIHLTQILIDSLVDDRDILSNNFRLDTTILKEVTN